MVNLIEEIIFDEVEKYSREIQVAIDENRNNICRSGRVGFKINPEVHEKISDCPNWERPYRTFARLSALTDLAESFGDIEYLDKVLPRYRELLPRIENEQVKENLRRVISNLSAN